MISLTSRSVRSIAAAGITIVLMAFPQSEGAEGAAAVDLDTYRPAAT